MAIHYPGIHWTTRTPARLSAGPGACVTLKYRVTTVFDLWMGGNATGSGVWTVGEDYTVNGDVLTIETAPRVLRNLLAPSNNGIGP
ncbi:MAG: hypothetical protein AABZ12_02960 [Planctomycetota bacterium]